MGSVTALIVPHGKVVDFIDGTLRKETPEEYVRQESEKSIVREYRYLREEISVEFKIKVGVARKRVDLAILPEGVAHRQEMAWAIIECKAADVPPNDKKEGVEQLKSYLAACLNAEFGMWTNGQDRLCFRKVRGDKKVEFVEINDIPVKGKSLDDTERPDFGSLRPATSDALLFTFKRCHNYIAGNQLERDNRGPADLRAERVVRISAFIKGIRGGRGGDRTPDFLRVKEALYR